MDKFFDWLNAETWWWRKPAMAGFCVLFGIFANVTGSYALNGEYSYGMANTA